MIGKRKIPVRHHKRQLQSGQITSVKRHSRMIEQKSIKESKKVLKKARIEASPTKLSQKELKEMYGIIYLQQDRYGNVLMTDENGKDIAYLQIDYDIEETIKNLGLTKSQKDDLSGGFKVEVANTMGYGEESSPSCKKGVKKETKKGMEKSPTYEVGKTIISQINTLDKNALKSYGAKNLLLIENGVQFDVSGSKHKGRVIVTLNEMDTYDIEIGKVNMRALSQMKPEKLWESKAKVKDIYVENLVETLDNLIG